MRSKMESCVLQATKRHIGHLQMADDSIANGIPVLATGLFAGAALIVSLAEDAGRKKLPPQDGQKVSWFNLCCPPLKWFCTTESAACEAHVFPILVKSEGQGLSLNFK
jgi:hypothetical protein